MKSTRTLTVEFAIAAGGRDLGQAEARSLHSEGGWSRCSVDIGLYRAMQE